MTISVLLADDQELVRAGFRMIIGAQPDMTVVAEAVDGQQAVQRALEVQPDVVLMDVRMPTMDGIAAVRELVAAGASCRVCMLTTFDLDEYVYEAVRAGASGFLLKDVPPGELVHAIRVTARGDALLAPALTARLLSRFARQTPLSAPPGLGQLTERETEVLQVMARGWSNAEIAAHFVISETTVKTHVTRILAKLGARDRVQAVVMAHESGLARGGVSSVESGPG
jgi:DNA-binding NarL/FixJ family response regulator